jgi:hypothetical protein
LDDHRRSSDGHRRPLTTMSNFFLNMPNGFL